MAGFYSLSLGICPYDHYSDFGATTNPKSVLTWAPIESWTLRAIGASRNQAPSIETVTQARPRFKSFHRGVPGSVLRTRRHGVLRDRRKNAFILYPGGVVTGA